MQSQTRVQRPISDPERASGRTFSALRHRNYQLYFGGQLISVAGTWMQTIAQGWLVYQLTYSEAALGMVAFASAIPNLLCSPYAGVMVDRVQRRNLLVITQVLAMLLAFILSALTFVGAVQVWHVIVLAVLLGVVTAFDAPARQSFVIEMVGKDDLSNAIALNSLMFNSGRVIGPALGGVLLALVGPAWCFFINGVSFLAVIAGLLAMRLPPRLVLSDTHSVWQQFASGLRYIRSHGEILGLILLATIFSVFGMSYAAILPAFVDRVLHVGASAYGAISAATGVGAVTGAFFLARNPNLHQRSRWLIAANFFFCVVLTLFAWNTAFSLSLLLGFGLGIGFMTQFTLMNTLLQQQVDDSMRGRVMSLYTLSFFGVAPFGNLLIGYLAEAWGISLVVTGSSVLAAFLPGLVLIVFPGLRHLD